MSGDLHELRIRAATLADADTVAAFNIAMAQETEQKRLDPEVVGRGVRRVLGDAALGRYYVAERAGPAGLAEIVGQMLLTFEFSDWRDGLFWWIQSVYVRPDARRAGVYRALHEHVAQAARVSGDACGLRLYVDRHNTRAQQVYRRLGMVATEYALFETDWSGPGP